MQYRTIIEMRVESKSDNDYSWKDVANRKLDTILLQDLENAEEVRDALEATFTQVSLNVVQQVATWFRLQAKKAAELV